MADENQITVDRWNGIKALLRTLHPEAYEGVDANEHNNFAGLTDIDKRLMDEHYGRGEFLWRFRYNSNHSQMIIEKLSQEQRDVLLDIVFDLASQSPLDFQNKQLLVNLLSGMDETYPFIDQNFFDDQPEDAERYIYAVVERLRIEQRSSELDTDLDIDRMTQALYVFLDPSRDLEITGTISRFSGAMDSYVLEMDSLPFYGDIRQNALLNALGNMSLTFRENHENDPAFAQRFEDLVMNADRSEQDSLMAEHILRAYVPFDLGDKEFSDLSEDELQTLYQRFEENLHRDYPDTGILHLGADTQPEQPEPGTGSEPAIEQDEPDATASPPSPVNLNDGAVIASVSASVRTEEEQDTALVEQEGLQETEGTDDLELETEDSGPAEPPPEPAQEDRVAGATAEEEQAITSDFTEAVETGGAEADRSRGPSYAGIDMSDYTGGVQAFLTIMAHARTDHPIIAAPDLFNPGPIDGLDGPRTQEALNNANLSLLLELEGSQPHGVLNIRAAQEALIDKYHASEAFREMINETVAGAEEGSTLHRAGLVVAGRLSLNPDAQTPVVNSGPQHPTLDNLNPGNSQI